MLRLTLGVIIGTVAAVSAGCGGEDREVEPLSASACSEPYYAGEGKPDLLIVSDLPRSGIGRETTSLMVDAIRLVLRQRGFRAGEQRVAYQSCNDTVGDEPFDLALCERNAKAYAANGDVLGVIGPWNSGCAVAQIPVLSAASAGPLAMISPANTYIGLTRKGPAADAGHPGSLYGDGGRNYVRIVPPDDVQAAGAAALAKSSGARRVAAIVVEQDAYARSLGAAFVAEARSLGLGVQRFAWPEPGAFRALAERVSAARPQAVYLAGLALAQLDRLLVSLRAALPARTLMLGPEAFAELADELGPLGEDMRILTVGLPPERLPPAGRRFLREFGKPPFAMRGFFGAPEAAQAAEVLLDAIARSDGTRASVVAELFRTKVREGILGSFSFDRNGDIVPAPIGVFRFRDGRAVLEQVVRVSGDTRG